MSVPETSAPAGTTLRNAVAVLIDGREPERQQLAELERRGQPLLVITLNPRGKTKRKPGMMDRTVDVQPLSLASFVANALRFTRSPARYLATAVHSLFRPRLLLTSAYIADLVDKRGIRHMHAFGSTAAVAKLATRAARLSVTSGDASVDELMATFGKEERTAVAASDAILAVDWTRVGLRPIGTRWSSARPDSTVAEVEVEDGATRRTVIYKDIGAERDGSRTAAERARHEHDTFNALNEAMTRGPAEFSVPRALLLDESRGVVLLERAAGTSLDELLGSTHARSNKDDVARSVRRAGQWLRAMQQNTRVEGGDTAAALAYVMRGAYADVERVTATDRTLRRHREKIIAALRELEARVAKLPLPLVGHHGDYWPGNIFISPDRVVVIDFEGFRHGLPLEDVTYFLVMLELLSRRFHQNMPALAAAFLEGYSDGQPLDPDAMRLFTLTKTLQMMGHTGAHRPLLLRRFITDTLRRKILGSAG